MTSGDCCSSTCTPVPLSEVTSTRATTADDCLTDGIGDGFCDFDNNNEVRTTAVYCTGPDYWVGSVFAEFLEVNRGGAHVYIRPDMAIERYPQGVKKGEFSFTVQVIACRGRAEVRGAPFPVADAVEPRCPLLFFECWRT